jgi:glycine cleavage system aminomethyltransferase T
MSTTYSNRWRWDMLPAALAADGTEVEVEINGEMYSAKVVGSPLYDPSGERMRA